MKVGENEKWIVQGSCGSWNDYREWQIAAFESEDLAIQYVKLLKERLDEIIKLSQEEILKIKYPLNKYDCEMPRSDVTEVSYNYFSLGIFSSPEEYCKCYNNEHIWLSPQNKYLQINMAMINSVNEVIENCNYPRGCYRKVMLIILNNNYCDKLFGAIYTSREECIEHFN